MHIIKSYINDRHLFLFMQVLLLLLLFGCKFYDETQNEKPHPITVSKLSEQPQQKPVKSPRIKLHRNAKGEYSWDITADSVDEILKADRKLRKVLINSSNKN